MARVDKLVAKIADQAASALEPGEQVEAAFEGVSRLNTASGFARTITNSGTYRLVVATETRIAVFCTSQFSPERPDELLASVPRPTPIMCIKKSRFGSSWLVEVGGKRVYVKPKWLDQIRRIDPTF